MKMNGMVEETTSVLHLDAIGESNGTLLCRQIDFEQLRSLIISFQCAIEEVLEICQLTLQPRDVHLDQQQQDYQQMSSLYQAPYITNENKSHP